MLPRQHRNRYALFVVLSLLVHALIVTVLMKVPAPNTVKSTDKKTVTVKLKKETSKHTDTKSSSKDDRPKKSEAEKAEPKKAEPKKSEPKKAQPKKAQPKKAEPKKAEPKKAQPKKAQPKKAQPKKAEPKKAQPKKAQPKKAQPKKAQPKKAQPKKAEPKKAQPKKAEVEPQEPTYFEQPLPDVKSEVSKKKGQGQVKSSEDRNTPLRRYGSMRVLDDREMKRAIVRSEGFSNLFRSRQQKGAIAIKNLNTLERQQLNQHLVGQVGYIFDNFNGPRKDGNKYSGEISILLDDKGYIDRVTFKKSSGYEALDNAVFQAVVATGRLDLPLDKDVRKAMVTFPLTLSYSEEDMAD